MKHPDVLRHNRGFRAYVTIRGDSYMSQTYATITEAIRAAERIREVYE